jgi:DNA replication protein DnaC
MTFQAKQTTLDSIKKNLVALRMPRALEVLDATFRRIEQGEIDGIEALDHLLFEELTVRENRRIKTALLLARLTAIKTLAGFDFAFQPSLDRTRILALAELTFIDRAEVVHLLGPPGTGKSHLATALAVEAVKAGRSVVFSTLADLIASLAKAEKEGTLRERIRYLCRASLLVVDEIGYLPVVPGGGNLFFQLVNARYEKGAMILTSNRGFAEFPSSRRLCSIAFSTTPSSSRSRARAIACANMPTSCRNTSARKRSSPRRPRQSAAAGLQERFNPITSPVDHRHSSTRPDQGILKAHICGDFGAH